MCCYDYVCAELEAFCIRNCCFDSVVLVPGPHGSKVFPEVLQYIFFGSQELCALVCVVGLGDLHDFPALQVSTLSMLTPETRCHIRCRCFTLRRWRSTTSAMMCCWPRPVAPTWTNTASTSSQACLHPMFLMAFHGSNMRPPAEKIFPELEGLLVNLEPEQ